MTKPIIHQSLLRKAISTTSSSLIFLVLGILEALWALCVSNKTLFGEARGKLISGLGLLAAGIFEIAVAIVIRTFVGYVKVVKPVFYFPFVITSSAYQTVLGQLQNTDDVNLARSQLSQTFLSSTSITETASLIHNGPLAGVAEYNDGT